MTTLSAHESRLAAAIEPWFGENAGAVAILLGVFTTPEGRTIFATQATEAMGDATALLAAINAASPTTPAATEEIERHGE